MRVWEVGDGSGRTISRVQMDHEGPMKILWGTPHMHPRLGFGD